MHNVPIYEDYWGGRYSHIWLCNCTLWISLSMRKIFFSFLSVHALTSASLFRPPVSSARWWGWDPPQEGAAAEAAPQGRRGGRPEASAATEVVAKRGRRRRRNTVGRHLPPTRGATKWTFLQFSERRNFAQREQLCTAKFLCQRLVWSKRIIAVLFTSLFSREFVHNLTLSHMAYFMLFVRWPGVQLDPPMKKTFD